MQVSLKSPRYFRLIESWNDFLLDCQNSDQLPKTAHAPIGKIARDCIWDIYCEFLRKSEDVSLDTKADELCELHQISKHLGYHMDVFSSLFPIKRMNRLLKAHDRLQSSLNQFRDMNLQYSRLKEYKSKMKKVQAVRKISLEAVEQLIADRKSEKERARERVMNQIERFTREKMRNRFNSILIAPYKGSGV